MTSSDNIRRKPVAPLPNPGEGGPVDSGGGIPGSLLPGFEEGGPVGGIPGNLLPGFEESGPVGGIPGSLLPGFEESGPVGGIPGSLLPGWGEGGPAAPGPVVPPPGRPPAQEFPCFYCDGGRTGKLRFLNAAYGYPPLRVYINNRYIVNGLGFASLTPYGRVSNGFSTITVTGPNGYVYLQKSMPLRSEETATMAIINSAGGIDLMQITDSPCRHLPGMSCLRACNLAYNCKPLDLVLQDGRQVYTDLRFKETTAYKRVRPGEYSFYLTETRPRPRFMDIETLGASAFVAPQPLVSFYVDVRPNSVYTIYILGGDRNADLLQVMVAEDR